MLAINFIGDGLRDALDPRQRIVIDVNVLVGGSPRRRPARGEYGLDAALARAGTRTAFAAALVASRAGASVSTRGRQRRGPACGRQLDDGVQLWPVATLNPVQYLDWPRELERVLAAGAVGLRFFPELQGWTVHAEAFRRHRPGGARAVSAAGAGHALRRRERDRRGNGRIWRRRWCWLGGHYTQLGDCLAAMERWPHLYLETSRLAQFRGVETVVRDVGAERLLFGSGAPARPVQAALNAVLAADISDAERRRFWQATPAACSGLLDGDASTYRGRPGRQV